MSQSSSRRSLAATPKTRPTQRKSMLGFTSASTKLRTQAKVTPLEKKLFNSASKPPISSSIPSSASRRWSSQGTSVKDTRALSNKSFQRLMVDAILEFLNESGYPHAISGKILCSPTTKEFLRVYEHLYNFILPNFMLDQKNYREEIPMLLKAVNFPFHISKSTMSGIGSMHAWPTLIGSLHWLVELLQTTSSIDIDQVLFPTSLQEDPAVVHKNIFFNQSIMSYEAFLFGQECFEKENNDLEMAIIQKCNLSEEDNITLEAEVNRLHEELVKLENQPDILEIAQQQKIEHQKMIHIKKQGLEASVQENTFLLQQHSNYMAQLNTEHEVNSKQLGNPQIQEELKRKSAEIDVQLNRLETEKERLEMLNDEREVNYTRIYNRCTETVHEYNDIAVRIKPNRFVQDFVTDQSLLLELDHSENNLNKFKLQLKPLLQELSHNLSDKTCKLESSFIKINHETEELEEFVSTKEKVDLVRLQQEHAVLEKELQENIMFSEKEHACKMEDLNTKDLALERKQKDINDLLETERKKLMKINQDAKELQLGYAEEENSLADSLSKYADKVELKKAQAEEEIDKLNEVLRMKIQEVRAARLENGLK